MEEIYKKLCKRLKSSESYNMERNLLKNELLRVRNFATLSENADYAYNELEEIIHYYGLHLF